MFPSICAYRATVVNSEALTGQQWLVIQTNLSDISGRTCPAYNINSCAKTHVTALTHFVARKLVLSISELLCFLQITLK